MILCDVVRLLASGSIPLVYTHGSLGIAQLYVIALVMGVALVFFEAASLASLPRVVPTTQLARATGLSAMAESATYVLGPGVASVIIGLASTLAVGAAMAYLVDSLSYLASAVTLGFIRQPFQEDRMGTTCPTLAVGNLRTEIAEGVRFLWGQHHLRTIALLTMGITLFDGPLMLTVIVLARDELHADARTIGLIFTLAGVGELLGSVVAPWVERRACAGHVLIGTIAFWAVVMPLEAAAISPLMLIVGIVLADIMIPIYNVTQISYRLSLIPDALQGRVNSAYRLPSYASGLLGTAASGVLLDLLGPRLILWIIAIGLGMCAFAASLTSLRRA